MPTPDEPTPSTSAADEARKRAELASLLQQGVAAAQRGRREQAQRLLEAALNIDPANEDAWLWLAAMTDNRSLARAMYRRILDDHPQSARARGALRWLEHAERCAAERSSTPAPASAEGGEDEPPFVPPWERPERTEEPQAAAARPPAPLSDAEARAPDAHRDEAPAEPPASAAPPEATPDASLPSAPAAPPTREDPEPDDAPAPQWTQLEPARGIPWQWPPTWLRDLPRRVRLPRLSDLARLGSPPRERLRDGAMIAMIGFLVIGSFILLSLLSSPSRATGVRVALGVITETPTITPSPTATLTPSATPTPTHTPTSTPSPTPSPTITLTPSPTPTPEWYTPKILPLPLDEKWIEVDLTTQTLYAYEGETRVFTATVSTGKGNTPTVQGKFRIQRKFESQTMAGPGYYLPNVPYIMYFYSNFALHGAYWHDKWGTPTSHGCVNLKREDAKWLYDWTDPPVPEGVTSIQATSANQGTWVIVHK